MAVYEFQGGFGQGWYSFCARQLCLPSTLDVVLTIGQGLSYQLQ